MVDVCSTWNMETMCDGEHVAWGDWTGLDAINSGEQWDVDNDAKQAQENVDYTVIEREASKNTTTDSSDPSSPDDHSSNNNVDANTTHHGKLFVGGLPSTCTKEDLKEYFSRFGYILDCVVMFDKDNRHRGFGFVTFSKPSEKNAVMATYDQHFIKRKWVEVKNCIPKHDMDSVRPTYSHNNNYLGNNTAIDHNINFQQEQQQQPHRRYFKNGVNKFINKIDIANGQGSTSDDSHLPMPQRLEKVNLKIDKALQDTDLLQNRVVANIFTDISELREMQDKLATKIHSLRNNTSYGQRLDKVETQEGFVLDQQFFAMTQYYSGYAQYECTARGTPMSTMVDAMSPTSNMWGPLCPTFMCPGPDPFDDSPTGTPRA